MRDIKNIAVSLKADLPDYNFYVYRGLFEKYIAVESVQKIIFTIWIDKNSEYKELLDEVDLVRSDFLKRIFKTRLFHWTKYKNQLRRDYHRMILEKMELSSKSRKEIREELELSLHKIHIA
jgi:CO dehydrogenase/acetyl-CoA synthase alpha subunit